MKKLNRLLVIEGDPAAAPLPPMQASLLASFSEAPVTVLFENEIDNYPDPSLLPLVLFHRNLLSAADVQAFRRLSLLFPEASLVVVSREQDEDLALEVLEAGAEDCVTEAQLNEIYLRKTALLSVRRHQKQAAAKHYRQQLFACIQNTPHVAVQWYNLRGEVVFWNTASERIFGWSTGDAVGKTLDRLMLSPEETRAFEEKIRRLKDGTATFEPEEWAFTRRDGKRRSCLSTLFAIPSPENDSLFVCMDVDVTEQKEMERALRESKENYQTMFNEAADAIFINTVDGRLLDVNRRACELLNMTREEVLRLRVEDLFSPQELSEQPIMRQELKNGEQTFAKRTLVRAGGEAVPVEITARQIRDNEIMAIVRDVTKRIEVQRQLEREIALSQTIIDSLPAVFYLFRKDGMQLRWNKRLETESGYSTEEISRMSPLDFLSGEDVYAVFHSIENVFQKGEDQVEAYLHTKDGRKIPYFFTGTAVTYGGEECLLGTGIDLTALKNLENELAQQKIAGQKKMMQAMIEAEEKEKAKLGLELHDNVNQILSVVRMYLTILNSDRPMNEVTLPKAIGLLNSAIDEIRHLSHALAVSYKFEMGLAGTLHDMTEKIGLAKDIAVELRLPPDLDDRTDNHQKLALYRIVQEQLNNVLKHAGASRVVIAVEITEEEIRLVITDNGRGFNPADARKGLGISNMTNRAEALEGRAVIHSRPGAGCRLEVTLPLKPSAKPADAGD